MTVIHGRVVCSKDEADYPVRNSYGLTASMQDVNAVVQTGG